METSIIIQYLVIAALALGACWYIFNLFKKSFSKKKFNKNSSCDSNCGCS